MSTGGAECQGREIKFLNTGNFIGAGKGEFSKGERKALFGEKKIGGESKQRKKKGKVES